MASCPCARGPSAKRAEAEEIAREREVAIGFKIQQMLLLDEPPRNISSFHIPDKLIEHNAWHDRYGDQYRANRCRMQRQERQILEKHSIQEGCRLIVNPYIDYSPYGSQAREVRLV